jgi:hypothetical protein
MLILLSFAVSSHGVDQTFNGVPICAPILRAMGREVCDKDCYKPAASAAEVISRGHIKT